MGGVLRPRAGLAAICVSAVWAWQANAAAANTSGASAVSIYSCVDGAGNRVTSDRPIPECAGREQKVLNRDGSVQRVVPPDMTAEERSAWEAREQQRAADLKAQQDLIRRDRNLMKRYPTEASHTVARAAALDAVRQAVRNSEARLRDLAAERKPLLDESEFYVGKPLPVMLKQQLDANDASTEAQRLLVQNQQAEIGRINASFDIELVRLRKLWAGAAPGSLGPLETNPQPPADPKAAASKPAP